jgi:hypothetical protein
MEVHHDAMEAHHGAVETHHGASYHKLPIWDIVNDYGQLKEKRIERWSIM